MNSINLSEIKYAVVDWMESSFEEQSQIPDCVPYPYEAERRIRRASRELLEGVGL